jgi:transcriptional regulator with XRE-family HTH domain
MSCSKQLKIIRCANKLKQYQVADALGISRSTYCSYETGRRSVELETLSKLSHFYKLPIDSFFEDSYVDVVSENDNYECDFDEKYLSQLSAEEISLIAKLRAMNDKDKEEIITIANSKVTSKP